MQVNTILRDTIQRNWRTAGAAMDPTVGPGVVVQTSDGTETPLQTIFHRCPKVYCLGNSRSPYNPSQLSFPGILAYCTALAIAPKHPVRSPATELAITEMPLFPHLLWRFGSLLSWHRLCS